MRSKRIRTVESRLLGENAPKPTSHWAVIGGAFLLGFIVIGGMVWLAGKAIIRFGNRQAAKELSKQAASQ